MKENLKSSWTSFSNPLRTRAVRYVLIPEVPGHSLPSVNKITFGDQESNALIKGVSFGVVSPGQSVKQHMYLASAGSAGERVLDVSVQTKLVASSSSSTSATAEANETLRTIAIPVVYAFSGTSSVAYHRSPGQLAEHLDLTIYDKEHFTPQTRAIMTTQITCGSKWDIEIADVAWVSKVHLSGIEESQIHLMIYAFNRIHKPQSW